MKTSGFYDRHRLLRNLLATATLLSLNLHAATTDIAQVPLVSSSSTAVLPNVLFALDDSGSMSWSHMPDDLADGGSSVDFYYGFYGLRSAQCNGVFYDPAITYNPPVKADGTNFANASFTAAWTNGITATGSVNLSTSFKAGDTSSWASQNYSGYTIPARGGDSVGEAAYYYKYTGAQLGEAKKKYQFANTSTNVFTKECSSAISTAPGNAVFTKVVVSASSGPGATDERQNFANWYSYYRNRMLMMKTAAGRAFRGIDDRYRVGYVSMNNNAGSQFLNLAPFNATQKTAWYGKLYAASASNSTPLRQMLEDAGRLYAGKLATLNGVAVTDPIQYACQQNFTILSTDGYWNQTGNPKQVDGSTDIGNQDGGVPRPYNDGGNLIQTIVTTSTTTVQKETDTVRTQTTPWTRTSTTLGGTCTTSTAGGGCIADNNGRTWCMYGSSGLTNTGSCSQPGNSGAVACRISTGGTVAGTGGVGCKTASGGQQWCVFSSFGSGTSCSALGSAGGAYVCKPVSTTGTSVSTQTQTYSQVRQDTLQSIDNTATTTSTTVITTNGIAAPPTNSTSAPVTTNVSTATTPISDTGAPNLSTVWSPGAVTVTCQASPPAPGVGAATAGAVVTTNGTPMITTLSTTTTGGTPQTTTSSSGGSANSLSDTAYYYYVTDLRDASFGNQTGALGTDISDNIVPASGLDSASWQHMTTFTLGLGARGRMSYTPTYATDSSGDFFSVKNGTTANAASGICSWQADGTTCNWPAPGLAANGDGLIANIDDLWHAAVNGRGTFYSATNPDSLAAAISSALAGVSARTGTSAAATTSNPNVTTGDNFVFNSTFTTSEWDGELSRYTIDLVNGIQSASPDWTAQSQLDSLPFLSRVIYTRDSAAANGLKLFTWGTLSVTEQAYFSLANISTMSQFCAAGPTCLSAANQLSASGLNLVHFLRGDRSNEGATTDPSKYYRLRTHVLGDIVSAEAVYVKGSLLNYADTGYSSFVATNQTRVGRVYVAANDGMVHAFDSNTGAEVWAYVPSFILPGMFTLADKNYNSLHRYFMDGTPVSGDVYFGGAWHTILVGGQNGGGRGYYAMDVTNPAAPKVLWEFTDTNLGLTFGNPELTKLKDGTWVVLVASGYNNVTPGDGVGRLYVLNAQTGAIIRTISTGVGNTTTPSGLAKIRAWVDNATSDNTALRVYGGDLLGNVWRFDINGDVGAGGYDAQRLVTLVDASSNPQPITAKPELGDVSGKAVIFVGTGEYLGASDLSNMRQQSFYAIKDNLDAVTLGSPRVAASRFIQQTESNTLCPAAAPASVCSTGQNVRTTSSNTVNFATDNGWFIDYPDSGERSNTDSTLALGTLAFNTNVPNASACTVGGYSNAYFLDYRTGSAVSTAGGVVSARLGNALATRPVLVRLPNNKIVELTRMSDGTTLTRQVPIGSGAGTTRRISWREIVND